MKPKTKEQARLLEIVQLQPDLTEKQLEYAKKNCFSNIAIESRGRIVCTQCGHAWRPKDADKASETQCPHCKRKLTVQHNKASYEGWAYLTITKQVDDYQAFRFIRIRRKAKANKVYHWYHDVGTTFMDMNGKMIDFTLGRFTMGYVLDAWSFDSQVELRGTNVLSRLYTDALICKSIHPVLKRNGWNGKLFKKDAVELTQKLLTDPKFESLWKIGQFGICEFILGRYGRRKNGEIMERIIKLANRHGKIFKTINEWTDMLDYVDDLIELGKDFGNPKVLFPENFQEEKMRINDKVHQKREREERERQARRAMEQAEREKKKKEWINKYQRTFKEFSIMSNGLTITPLLTKKDFEDEYKALKHCIRSYYGKEDALLVSISYNGEKLETAEIDLKNYNIVQCRGKYNHPSNKHDEIVKLIEKNMRIIKAYNNRKFEKKKKNSVTQTTSITPNLPAIIYKMAI